MNKDHIIGLLCGVILGLCIGFYAGYKKAESDIAREITKMMQDHLRRNYQLVR